MSPARTTTVAVKVEYLPFVLPGAAILLTPAYPIACGEHRGRSYKAYATQPPTQLLVDLTDGVLRVELVPQLIEAALDVFYPDGSGGDDDGNRG